MIRFCTHFAPLSYRYFYDPLIDIDISQRLPIDIDIFQNCLIDIDIDIFQNSLIDIDIQKCRYIDNQYSISIYRTGLRCWDLLVLLPSWWWRARNKKRVERRGGQIPGECKRHLSKIFASDLHKISIPGRVYDTIRELASCRQEFEDELSVEIQVWHRRRQPANARLAIFPTKVNLWHPMLHQSCTSDAKTCTRVNLWHQVLHQWRNHVQRCTTTSGRTAPRIAQQKRQTLKCAKDRLQ